jgi:hypothetical protein
MAHVVVAYEPPSRFSRAMVFVSAATVILLGAWVLTPILLDYLSAPDEAAATASVDKPVTVVSVPVPARARDLIIEPAPNRAQPPAPSAEPALTAEDPPDAPPDSHATSALADRLSSFATAPPTDKVPWPHAALPTSTPSPELDADEQISSPGFGPVPLPRKRPAMGMADLAVPLPRPRPETGPTVTPPEIDGEELLFRRQSTSN